MATSQKQQAERNITKHRNYIKFIKNYYDTVWIMDDSLVSTVRNLVKLEKRKAK